MEQLLTVAGQFDIRVRNDGGVIMCSHMRRYPFAAALFALTDMGREIPVPLFVPNDMGKFDASGKFLTRVPKFIHARLSTRAKAEDVSLNTLVLTFIEGLSRRETHA